MKEIHHYIKNMKYSLHFDIYKLITIFSGIQYINFCILKNPQTPQVQLSNLSFLPYNKKKKGISNASLQQTSSDLIPQVNRKVR